MATSKSVPLKPPTANPHNIQATKYYVFNETGNIMLASTVDSNTPIETSVAKVFAEVSVFFAAMTRAISTTINPVTGEPYSIYNYTALSNVISGSGLFVHVTEEDVTYTTTSVGVDFSKELLEALLGLASGAGAMSFASAMVASMGDAGLKIAASHSSTDSKVANIVFVCEYLLGMPIVSAIVVYADVTENKQSLSVGPCFHESSITSTWKLHKDTYMFVTPTFIKAYATDLDSVESDPGYDALVSWLQGIIQRTPSVSGIFTDNFPPADAPSQLAIKTTYALEGLFLPTTAGSLKIGSTALTVKSWSSSRIEFEAPAAITTAGTIDVYAKGGTTPVASSQSPYTAK